MRVHRRHFRYDHRNFRPGTPVGTSDVPTGSSDGGFTEILEEQVLCEASVGTADGGTGTAGAETGTFDIPIGTADRECLGAPQTVCPQQKPLDLGGSLVRTVDGLTGTSGTLYRNCRRAYRNCRPENPRDLPTLDPLGNPDRNCRLNYRKFRSPVPELPMGLSALPVQFSQRPKTSPVRETHTGSSGKGISTSDRGRKRQEQVK